LEVINVKRYYK